MQKQKAIALIFVVGLIVVAMFSSSDNSPEATDTQRSMAAVDYSSPYMNAADTSLSTLENGALVSPETVAYWSLAQDSPKISSYDRDAVITVA